MKVDNCKSIKIHVLHATRTVVCYCLVEFPALWLCLPEQASFFFSISLSTVLLITSVSSDNLLKKLTFGETTTWSGWKGQIHVCIMVKTMKHFWCFTWPDCLLLFPFVIWDNIPQKQQEFHITKMSKWHSYTGYQGYARLFDAEDAYSDIRWNHFALQMNLLRESAGEKFLFSKQIFFLCNIVGGWGLFLSFSRGITYKPSVFGINWIPSRLSSDFSSRETPKMVSEITRWESDFPTKCECIK